jgi:hypothetical protein
MQWRASQIGDARPSTFGTLGSLWMVASPGPSVGRTRGVPVDHE